MAVTVRPLTPEFAAEVSGIDARHSIPDADFAVLRAAFEEHSVLVLHGQRLSDDEQVAFSERFGPLEDSLVGTRGEGSYFAKLSNIADDGGLVDPGAQKMLFSKANEFWHTDSSFKPWPPSASILIGRVIPPEGGETEFCSMRAAHAALPAAIKARLAGLWAEHDLSRTRDMVAPGAMTAEQRKVYPPVRHAVVRANPVNGRKTLYLGAHVTRIVGMEERESRALIDELIAFGTGERFVYRHHWTQDDMLIWDNRCVLHRGRPWDRARYARSIQRTTVAGLGPTEAA